MMKDLHEKSKDNKNEIPESYVMAVEAFDACDNANRKGIRNQNLRFYFPSSLRLI